MRDERSQDRTAAPPRVLCVGGAVVDSIFVAQRLLRPGTSNPAAGSRSFGGVARNVAVNLRRLGVASSLCSVVGDDRDGTALIDDLERIGVETAAVRRHPGARTALYVALLEPDRSLAVAVADMLVLDAIGRDDVARAREAEPDWIFVDCNCPAAVLSDLMGSGARLAVDAVSIAKAERLPEDLRGVDLLFLNLDEAAAVLRLDPDAVSPEMAVGLLQARGAASVVLTLGSDGLAAGAATGAVRRVASFPARVVDVTGAGDALIAGCLAGLLSGADLPEAARLGAAATHTLERRGSTAADLSFDALAGHFLPAARDGGPA